MSAFDDNAKDNLFYEIHTFLADHTISELLEVVEYCVEAKESEYMDD